MKLLNNLSPCPLPLIREGGVSVREGLRPSSTSIIAMESERGFAPLILYLPLSFQERGTKGVRLINNLSVSDYYETISRLCNNIENVVSALHQKVQKYRLKRRR